MEICNYGLDCHLPNDNLTSIRFRRTIKRYANTTSIFDHDADSGSDDGICDASIAQKVTRKMDVEIVVIV